MTLVVALFPATLVSAAGLIGVKVPANLLFFVAIEFIFLLNLINILGTLRIRKVRPLYVSMWWAIAAPMWLMASRFIGKVLWVPGVIWPFHGTVGNPSGYLSTGVHDAMINWWGNHNLFGLWLTPVLIAVCYYFVPRITNTPTHQCDSIAQCTSPTWLGQLKGNFLPFSTPWRSFA